MAGVLFFAEYLRESVGGVSSHWARLDIWAGSSQFVKKLVRD